VRNFGGRKVKRGLIGSKRKRENKLLVGERPCGGRTGEGKGKFAKCWP